MYHNYRKNVYNDEKIIYQRLYLRNVTPAAVTDKAYKNYLSYAYLSIKLI